MVTKEQIGVYKCWSCSREVPVKKTSTGKLSAPCGWCDFPHYANPGTEHYKRLLAATTLDKKTDAPPAPTPPAPKPAGSGNPFAGGR